MPNARGLWGLAAIVVLAATPRAQAPAAPTPNEYGRAPKLEVQPFLGLSNRLRFDMPRKDWRVVSGGVVTLLSLVHKDGEAAVVIEATRLARPLNPEDMTDLFAQLEAEAIKERQPLLSNMQAKLVAAADGRRVVIVTYSRRGAAGPERVRQYSIPAGSDLFRLTCSAVEKQFPRYEPVFAYVAATFTPVRTN